MTGNGTEHRSKCRLRQQLAIPVRIRMLGGARIRLEFVKLDKDVAITIDKGIEPKNRSKDCHQQHIQRMKSRRMCSFVPDDLLPLFRRQLARIADKNHIEE